MEIEEKIKNLTLKQKLNQMFIAGFQGDNPNNRKEFQDLLKNGLGGIIFFSENIKSIAQFKNIISNIKDNATIPPFLSIDQEGGRVERTESIHNGKKYLSARDAANKGKTFLETQTNTMAQELKSYGINMNFAPVLDVNTNEKNPIIGVRAYATNPEEVEEYGLLVSKTYIKNGIIPVGKHFPGHGDASIDSHKNLPIIDLPINDLEKNHIAPFKKAIEEGIPAIMVAHVHYPSLEPENIPSSMSKKVINEYLIKKLGFEGVIISDDMVMGAIQGFSSVEACQKAINAGITMFIFRDTNKKVLKLINDLEKLVSQGYISEKIIDKNIEKILTLKQKFNLI